MGALVSSLFVFGTHADTLSFRVWDSFIWYHHEFEQELYTLEIYAGHFPGTPSSCNCITMSFYCLIEPNSGFPDFDYQPYSPSLSHVQPSRAILYIFCSLIPHFLLGGDFPPSVVILHMFPCIEHRYVPLLGTSLFDPWHSSPPIFVTIKHFYSFSRFSKYLKKFKKKSKKQKAGHEKMLSLSSRVMSPLNIELCNTSIGWVFSLTLGFVLVTLSLSPPTR